MHFTQAHVSCGACERAAAHAVLGCDLREIDDADARLVLKLSRQDVRRDLSFRLHTAKRTKARLGLSSLTGSPPTGESARDSPAR